MDASKLSLTSSDKTVLAHLSSFCGPEFTCYPSISAISKTSGLSQSTVKRSISSLVKLKIISKKNRYSSTGPTSNLYSLHGVLEILKATNVPKRTQKKECETLSVTPQHLAEDGKYYNSPSDYYLQKNKKKEFTYAN